MGVDLAYRRSGFVILDDGNLAHQDVVGIHGNPPDAFFEARNKWSEIRQTWQPHTLVLEIPNPIWRNARKSNYQTIVRIAQMLPIIVIAMAPCHISLVEPSKWKKFFTSKHNASKDETRQVALRLCPDLKLDGDIIDAFLIALWEFRYHPAHSLLPAQRHKGDSNA